MNIEKKVAVYGTLRADQPLAHVWQESATASVGIVTGFGLVVRDDCEFPVAKWTGKEHDIIVVDILSFRKESVFKRVVSEMDRIEGHPLLFRRQKVTAVRHKDSKEIDCWMYVGADPRMFHNGAILEDGDWSEFVTGLPTVFE